jgi:tetratricopeptide (TPR) repeat protein
MDGGNYGEAVKLFSAALDANPDYPYALLNRGLSRYKMGDCGGASEDLTRAIDHNNKFELAYYHRALCARNARNVPAELADLDAVLALNPAAVLARFERGKALFYMADYAGSAQEFDKAAKLKPEDAVYPYWEGFALLRAGSAADALKAAQGAAALAQTSHQLEGLLADCYAALGDKAAAAAHYRKAAALSPKYAAGYNARLAALESPAPARPKAKKRR